MISREEFEAKGFEFVSENNYSFKITMQVGVINNVPQVQENTLSFEVDSEENELGTYVVIRENNIIVHTGYYTDINDLLSDF